MVIRPKDSTIRWLNLKLIIDIVGLIRNGAVHFVQLNLLGTAGAARPGLSTLAASTIPSGLYRLITLIIYHNFHFTSRKRKFYFPRYKTSRF